MSFFQTSNCSLNSQLKILHLVVVRKIKAIWSQLHHYSFFFYFPPQNIFSEFIPTCLLSHSLASVSFVLFRYNNTFLKLLNLSCLSFQRPFSSSNSSDIFLFILYTALPNNLQIFIFFNHFIKEKNTYFYCNFPSFLLCPFISCINESINRIDFFYTVVSFPIVFTYSLIICFFDHSIKIGNSSFRSL